MHSWAAHLGRRIVTLKRARVVATLSIAGLVVTYGSGLARRHGLVDGFGHVVGADLLAQRVASQMTRDGHGDRLYDFELQARYEQAEVAPEMLPGLDPFVTPPYVALAYWPLMPLHHGVAFVIWTAIGLACFTASLFWLSRDHPFVASWSPTVLLLSLSFYPVGEGLMAGSNMMVSLLLFTAVFMSLKHGRDAAAGVFLGLQLFKPQLVVATLVVLVVKRRWKAVLAFGVVGAIWLAASIVLVSRHSVAGYLHVVPSLIQLNFAEGFPNWFQSSLYALFLIPLGPESTTVSIGLGSIASLGVLAALVRLWSGAWAPASDDFDVRFTATLIATALISQHFMLHDLTIMILGAVLLTSYWMGRAEQDGWDVTRFALAALWIACFIGPMIAYQFQLAVVPLATLFVGWTIWNVANLPAQSKTLRSFDVSGRSPGWSG